MRLETKPMGVPYSWSESDIIELNWGATGLRIVAELMFRSEPHKRVYIEYYWHGFTRHRMLEEVDLRGYWEGGNYEQGYLLFQVISGGWLSHAKDERIYFVSGQEWFLCTSNSSATVISEGMPTIRELKHIEY